MSECETMYPQHAEKYAWESGSGKKKLLLKLYQNKFISKQVATSACFGALVIYMQSRRRLKRQKYKRTNKQQ